MATIGLPGLMLITGENFDTYLGFAAARLPLAPFPMIDPTGAQMRASLIGA